MAFIRVIYKGLGGMLPAHSFKLNDSIAYINGYSRAFTLAFPSYIDIKSRVLRDIYSDAYSC